MFRPARWQPRRRRSDRLWWALVLAAGAFVITALAVRSFTSGDDGRATLVRRVAARHELPRQQRSDNHHRH